MSERVKEIVPDLIEAVRNVLRHHKVTFDEYRAGFGYMIGVQETRSRCCWTRCSTQPLSKSKTRPAAAPRPISKDRIIWTRITRWSQKRLRFVRRMLAPKT